jgi:branched-chain amino acid transport system ATP-binding protein
MTPLLTVANLNKSFGGVHAVKDVSFTVEPGQLVALIGPNGAGKSTTFNCLNGQLIPDLGAVTLSIDGDDHPLIGLKPHQIWQLGVGRTFQITATFLSMSVIENVQVALINESRGLLNLWHRTGDLHRDKAMALLEMVGLVDQADMACSILAYGDLKRLELALALANNPRLLLMDEPTAGMGMTERMALMTLTHSIAKEKGIGVLFTEHDMDVVFQFSDEVVVMHYGDLIAKGTVDDIRRDPRVREVYLGTEMA